MDKKQVFSPKRLLDARKALRHSQGSLANEIGASRNAIALYESGENVPGANVLAALACALGKPFDHFFEPADQSTIQTPKQTA